MMTTVSETAKVQARSRQISPHCARNLEPFAASCSGAPLLSVGASNRICPICGGDLEEVRAKLKCRRCRAIIETCCEGGPQR